MTEQGCSFLFPCRAAMEHEGRTAEVQKLRPLLCRHFNFNIFLSSSLPVVFLVSAHYRNCCGFIQTNGFYPNQMSICYISESFGAKARDDFHHCAEGTRTCPERGSLYSATTQRKRSGAFVTTMTISFDL